MSAVHFISAMERVCSLETLGFLVLLGMIIAYIGKCLVPGSAQYFHISYSLILQQKHEVE